MCPAIAQPSDAAVKIAEAERKSARRPSRSASAPAVSTVAASASV